MAEPSGQPPIAPRAPPSARCGLHTEVAAVDLCQRCGAFLCGECVELLGEDVLCPACFQRLGGHAPPSRQARLSAALGVLGLVLGPALFTRGILYFLIGLGPGLIGLWLARRELARIDAGRSPAVGRGWARLGRGLGWINFGLFSLAGLILAAVAILFAWRGAP